jgi:hypothetical protein
LKKLFADGGCQGAEFRKAFAKILPVLAQKCIWRGNPVLDDRG